jgi:hypothetical protein
MNSISIEYKRKVWGYLERLQPGERRKISALSAPENRENFIECIKEYMCSFPFDGWISFNHDFSEFYKSTPVPDEQIQKAKENSGNISMNCLSKEKG